MSAITQAIPHSQTCAPSHVPPLQSRLLQQLPGSSGSLQTPATQLRPSQSTSLAQQPSTGTQRPGSSAKIQSALQGQINAPEQIKPDSHCPLVQQPLSGHGLQTVEAQTPPPHSLSLEQHIGGVHGSS
jgi:hypothetical protein